MLVGVYVNKERDIGLAFTEKLIGLLRKENISFALHDSLKADCVSDADFFGDGCDPRPDIIIALGGDGTILSAVSFAAPAGIPVFGINLGAMGFLSAMTAADPSECVRMLKSGAYTVSERTMLETEVCGKRYHALNEIVFYKRNVGKTVIVSVKVDGSEIGSYKADGFIVSTPTGSTGYALSSGGPVVSPDVRCRLLVPICCHNLLARPVIADEDSVVTIDGNEKGCVIVDGKVTESEVSTLKIVKSAYKAKLVIPDGFDFYDRINRKLGGK